MNMSIFIGFLGWAVFSCLWYQYGVTIALAWLVPVFMLDRIKK